MDRREFLQLSAGGLLLSISAAKNAGGADVEEIAFSATGFSLILHASRGGAPPAVRSLRNSKTGFEWARPGAPLCPVFTASGDSVKDWTSQAVQRKHTVTGERCELVSRSKSANVAAKTILQGFKDAPILEFQTEFQSITKSSLREVTALGPLRLALRDDIGPLRVHAIRRDEYKLETIAADGPIDLTGGGWNAPQYAGLLLLEAVDKGEILLIGIEWERGWHYRIEEDAQGRWLNVQLSDLTHDMSPGEKIISPRVFLGLSQGDPDRAYSTAQQYLHSHVFPVALKNWPWVVYDFWATEAEGVQEALLREVDFAAQLGVEIFVHDASWYLGSSKKGTGDWGCGLGNYQDDREKFPMGLAAISRRVHEVGMKFGLWVGPNVVDSRLVGAAIPKLWLARVDGKDRTLKPDGWESSVDQVCLGCREYIDFLKRELTRIVREFRLDWLKWDNSGIPGSPANCNRTDHGHQAGDASYASLVGQYEIFDHLHAAFPDLVLEQCGYGSRLDYGLARTIRANWLSDASYPSENVRRGALVASRSYPSGDNGGWIVAEDKALLQSGNDSAALDTIFRSRMFCLFGFGTLLGLLKERVSLFPEPVLEAARRNMPIFKGYRHLLEEACYHLLPGTQSQPQAIQFVSNSGEESVVLVFKGQSEKDSVQLILRGLLGDSEYEITSANRRETRKVRGEELLSKGMGAALNEPFTSEVLLLRSRKL
jgi:alpha-galactosidase